AVGAAAACGSKPTVIVVEAPGARTTWPLSSKSSEKSSRWAPVMTVLSMVRSPVAAVFVTLNVVAACPPTAVAGKAICVGLAAAAPLVVGVQPTIASTSTARPARHPPRVHPLVPTSQTPVRSPSCGIAATDRGCKGPNRRDPWGHQKSHVLAAGSGGRAPDAAA